MIRARKWLIAAVLWGCLAVLPAALPAQTPPETPPGEIVTLLKEQHSKLSGDLRRIQREIAALRADLGKPGIQEIFSGIGYIFGLFGVAAFVASRRKR
jgi:nickel transport protein